MIENYESQPSEMKNEHDGLRKETESRNFSVGSFGDIQSEPVAESEEVSQSVDSSINISSDAVPSSNLKGAEGKWIKDEKPGTSRESRYQAMEEKLLVRQIFVVLFPMPMSKNVFKWIFVNITAQISKLTFRPGLKFTM